MCGINGLCWPDDSLCRKMANAQKHRGPDQSGFFTDDQVSLGHRRLKILDLSERGKNPIYNEDQSVAVVFNGEIYNYKPLRDELEKKGHRFSSQTDTEVIVHGYEDSGISCVKRFEGMFAFALWDSNIKKLFLVNDPAGIKPIYYAFLDGKLLFSSEIKGILAAGFPAKLNIGAFASLLDNLFITANRTMFEGIFVLPAGNVLEWDAKTKKTKIQPHFKLNVAPTNDSENVLLGKLNAVLSEAMVSSLQSDVPLAIALSGGLDSSLVAAYAIEKRPDVKTVTVGFGTKKDEFGFASKVAESLNAENQKLYLDFESAQDHLPEIVWHLEQPPARTAVLPTYLMAHEVKKHATVLLLGEGGDELFAGYERHYIFENKPFLKNAPVLRETYFKKGHEKYVDTVYADAMPVDATSYDAGSNEAVNSALAYDFANQMPGVQLLRVDKMTMAASIEARVPFLNKSVIETAFKVPSRFKVENGVGKAILKKLALQKGLPKDVIYRSKVGLQAPLNEWFQREFFEMAEHVLSIENMKETSVLKSKPILAMLKKASLLKHVPPVSALAVKAQNYYAGRIWFLTNFVLWNRVFLHDGHAKKLDDYY